MTRKEALSTLYTFWEAFFQLAGDRPQHGVHAHTWEEERQAVASQAYRALLTLTPGIHGKAPAHGSRYLCDRCHLRYADGEMDEEVGGVCTTCRKAREQAGAQGEEVQACQP
jgi:hypothetical protein